MQCRMHGPASYVLTALSLYGHPRKPWHTIRRAPKDPARPGIPDPTNKGICEAADCEISPRESHEQKTPSVMERELIEIDHPWGGRCARLFCNPCGVLAGLTLNEIIQHLKKMREQAFA